VTEDYDGGNMKYAALLLLPLGLSCNNIVTNPAIIEIETPAVQIEYTLTDTSKTPKTAFRSGESFILGFSMKNQTGKDLSIWESARLDDMLVYLNDSVVAYNQWGRTFPASLWVNYTMANGSKLTDSWVGPSGPDGVPRILLHPGEYNYRIVINIEFDDTVLVVTKPYSTQFTVVP